VSLENRIKARDLAISSKEKDPAKFILSHAKVIDSVILSFAGIQLDFIRSLEKKVPEWFRNKSLLTYQGVNIEQSSSESTALFKSQYLQGELGIDLTGGLGVDTYFISKRFNTFIHNEPSTELSEIVKYNFTQLDVSNVIFTQFKAEDFAFRQHFDWIYLDPSRRDSRANRVVNIEDCLPNLVDIQSQLLLNASGVMVKFSPMLDIKLALSKLKNVKEVLVLAEKNDVKELIFILSRESCIEPKITCVNLGSGQDSFSFKHTEEENSKAVFSMPMEYLYEPNATILKAGAFNSISSRFHLKKLAANSHLYTSASFNSDFPGRAFKIKAVTNYDKKSLKSIVPQNQANIACRNFPLKPEEIRKQLKWKDGGNTYLFFTESFKAQKLVIVTEKAL
jgi:hypothetical protein